MAITPEQQKFTAEVDTFLAEVRSVIREGRQLAVKVKQQNRRFKELEKLIQTMAKEHNITIASTKELNNGR